MKAMVGKRVLMLLGNALYPDDLRVQQEATALVAAGYRVSIICPRGVKRQQRWSEVIDGVSVYRYPKPPRPVGFVRYLWGYVYTLAAMFLLSLFVLLRRGFDVVHAHNPPDVLVFVAAFFKLLGKRFVFDHHDLSPEMYDVVFPDGNRLAHKMLVWLEKLSCRVADHVIATNQSYKQMEMQRGGVPAQRITVVRNGPDSGVIRPVEPDPDLYRPGKAMLCYVGSIGFHDGVDYLLRALHCLAFDLGRTDFYSIVVGGGKAQPSMQSLSEQLDLTDFVCFTGWVEHVDVARYLSTADICLAPEPSNAYNDRSSMIKLSEYIAVGKPVVAFDLPEHRVTAGDAAVYVQPNDELDFARKIAWLMDNPQRRQEMGQLGWERVEKEQLAWSYQKKLLLRAYESLGLRSEEESVP